MLILLCRELLATIRVPKGDPGAALATLKLPPAQYDDPVPGKHCFVAC